jgi:hypothetical protein
MFARESADPTASAFAVPGMSCSMPRAPAGERARGLIRDSSHATAASSEIGSSVSWAARRNAPTYAVGIPQAARWVEESFGAPTSRVRSRRRAIPRRRNRATRSRAQQRKRQACRAATIAWTRSGERPHAGATGEDELQLGEGLRGRRGSHEVPILPPGRSRKPAPVIARATPAEGMRKDARCGAIERPS